jgi:hypothetical protein
MLRPTDFLLQECKNVRSLLRNTLRYTYSSESSVDIYRECLARLDLIDIGFHTLRVNDTDELQELWVQLSRLSVLTGRVERSHIEEFSWPFARSLKELATSVCSGADSGEPPLFLFSADDELSSYEVETEQNAPGLLQRPLFSINFPRSLKPFVLLHAILGHEIGHAAFAIPKLSARLRKEVIDVLVAESPLADLGNFEKWVYRTRSKLSIEFMVEKAHISWPEELYCDLFGMVTMGPSYLGANCSLLLPFDMRTVSSSHPPGLTRYWMTDSAAKCLKWSDAMNSPPLVKQAATKYFGTLSAIAQKVPRAFQLLQPKQIRAAVGNLQRILQPMGKTLFAMPPQAEIKRMVERLLAARPPVESVVSKALHVSNVHVDFRSILLAGWLAWHSDRRNEEKLDFASVNMLCERAVLLQSAVDYWETNKHRRSKSRARAK